MQGDTPTQPASLPEETSEGDETVLLVVRDTKVSCEPSGSLEHSICFHLGSKAPNPESRAADAIQWLTRFLEANNYRRQRSDLVSSKDWEGPKEVAEWAATVKTFVEGNEATFARVKMSYEPKDDSLGLHANSRLSNTIETVTRLFHPKAESAKGWSLSEKDIDEGLSRMTADPRSKSGRHQLNTALVPQDKRVERMRDLHTVECTLQASSAIAESLQPHPDATEGESPKS